MVIKLYIDYISQPSRAVLALCMINKIPHEVIETRVNKLQNRSLQFAKINPMKKVPAIEDMENGMTLGESHAIMRYLCRKYKLDEHWYPSKDHPRMAKIDQYLDFHHLNTRLIANLIFNTMFAKRLGVSDPSFSEAKTKKNVEYALKCIDTIYLANNDYLVGNQISIADLSAYFEIQFLFLKDYNFAKWKNINKWMERVAQISELKTIDTIFMKVAAKIKQANL